MTIIAIFIVLLNDIDAKSLSRQSNLPQRDGYEPTKDRTMRRPNPTGSKPPMDREIREATSGGSGEPPKDRKIREPTKGGLGVPAWKGK